MHNSRVLQSRRAGALLPLVLILMCTATTVLSMAQMQDKDVRPLHDVNKTPFNDDDLEVERVGGKYTAATLPDLGQVNDPSYPVVVTRIKTFSGRGKYAGRLKILEATIENRSQRLIQSLQLRWAMMSEDEPDVVLLEGFTPFFVAPIKAHAAPVVDIPPIYFNKIIKPLLRDKELYGNFRIVVGIQEVHFEDGSRWQRPQPVATVGNLSPGEPPGIRLQYVTPILSQNFPSKRTTKIQPIQFTPCKGGPRLINAASAVLFSTLQITDPPCRENMTCGFNEEFKQICRPSSGTFCDLSGCDSEGHCNCSTGAGRCTTCPDNDGDGHAAKSCGGDDCNDTRDDANFGVSV